MPSIIGKNKNMKGRKAVPTQDNIKSNWCCNTYKYEANRKSVKVMQSVDYQKL